MAEERRAGLSAAGACLPAAQADIAAAAEAAGLEYHYMPVNAMNYPGPDLPAMKSLFDDVDRPVLVIGTHFAAPTAGRIVRDGGTYRLDY